MDISGNILIIALDTCYISSFKVVYCFCSVPRFVPRFVFRYSVEFLTHLPVLSLGQTAQRKQLRQVVRLVC
uniref:Uncharacterized protein n=1 Tax=Anopheles minimus TaxID=112268 RepID=A0A182WPA8_9DIPT